jgi:hypothetical protein
MLSIPLFMDSILNTSYPIVTLTDVRNDTANATTYTFTNCQVTVPPGGSLAGETVAASLYSKSGQRGCVVVAVHGEDDATAFSISSVSIGGVNGTEREDRGGGSNAINSGVYVWSASLLAGITNTDIVVTWGEAVTSCAIGVMTVTNIAFNGASGLSGLATNSGNINFTITPAITATMNHAVTILVASCNTGGGTERPQFEIVDSNLAMSPILLYEGSNAELDFAAAYAIIPGHSAGNGLTFRTTWSGTGTGDAVGVVLI